MGRVRGVRAGLALGMAGADLPDAGDVFSSGRNRNCGDGSAGFAHSRPRISRVPALHQRVHPVVPQKTPSVTAMPV